jgi:enamine deaminase RidA (YjgF/YER057c/UK114 family)
VNEILNASGWPRPRGYSNAIVASGRMLFLAGQIGWTPDEKIVEGGLVPQVEQALRNVTALLEAAGAGPEHLVRMTWYLTSRDEYVRCAKEIGAVYREVIGKNFPTMTAVEVVRLVEDGAEVEIECTAVLPG